MKEQHKYVLEHLRRNKLEENYILNKRDEEFNKKRFLKIPNEEKTEGTQMCNTVGITSRKKGVGQVENFFLIKRK